MIPYNTKITLPAVLNFGNFIREHVYTKVAPLQIAYFNTNEPVAFCEISKYEFSPISEGQTWGKLWDCAWFNFKGEIPKNLKKENVVLMIDIGGEACLYTTDGDTIRGLTNVNSEFDRSLGRPGKRIVPIKEITSNSNFEILADAGCNDLFGKNCSDCGKVNTAQIAICNDALRSLSYDYEVLCSLIKTLPNTSTHYYTLLFALENAMNCFSSGFTAEQAKKASEYLAPELNRQNNDYPLEFVGIGHAHLDLAWLWPIRESKRKAVRTFTTLIANLNAYPEYKFGLSQPQQLQWVKDSNPKLYEKIKTAVKAKRIELQGGMWVEPDTNVSGGEALVRQILYGTRFYKQEFDVEVNNVWLPDVFGFSGALPQIIKKSGLDNFLTIKLSWSEHNPFPHHTFNWEGIDNSSVLVHMPPEGTYNSECSPNSLVTGEKIYADKGVVNSCVILYGIGDGGGGPGRDHIERAKRLKNLLGLPKLRQGFIGDYFNEIAKFKNVINTVKGELYLEKHQGTLTTQSKNKLYNRKLERLLSTAEFFGAVAVTRGLSYPSKQLETIWKEVLLYQFHDILPGSSIKRVYDESVVRYMELEKEVNSIIDKLLENLSSSKKLSAYNNTGFTRKSFVKDNNIWYNMLCNGHSSANLTKCENKFTCSADKDVLNNDNVTVKFNDKGQVTSIFDKTLNKECLSSPSNCLKVYNDFGDAWDIYINYHKSIAGEFELVSAETHTDGPTSVRTQQLKFNNSTLTQTIKITEGSSIVDFSNSINWQENNKMFRTEFFVTPKSDKVNCDIQFGNIFRSNLSNNSLDYAMFEIAAHKYIDLSQDDFGVAILNDCKYGFRAKDNLLSINILRSPSYPAELADVGMHTYNYAVMPHSGNVYQGNVVKAAYEYNNPMILSNHSNEMTSLVSVNSDSIVIETIKKAEDTNDIIVRLSEQKNSHTTVNLTLDKIFKSANLTNLMEKQIDKLEIKNNNISLTFTPFEIKTISLKF